MLDFPDEGQQHTILIVDDTRENLRLLAGILKQQGYNVRLAPGGRMAISSACANPPNLILLDIMMPDIDGYTVCQELKADEKTRDIPIIFISALNEVFDKVKAFTIGGADYITKPFQVEEVLVRVKNQLTIQHTQEALRKSEERFRTVADLTYNWEYWVAPDQSYIYVSPACERISGYRVDEFMTNPGLLQRIIHPDDQAKVAEHAHAMAQAIGVRFLEFRIITRSGEERWISHTCQPVYNTHGIWMGSRASNRDITEQKRTEEALLQSEKRFRMLAENAQDMIFRYRLQPKRGFEYVSPAVEQIMGFTPEEYYQDPDMDLKCLHPSSLPKFGVMMDSSNGYREPIIMQYIRKDGNKVWIEQNHWTVCDEAGKVIAIEGISRDITERKQAEEELQTTYQNLKMLNDRLQSELNMAHRIQQSLLPAPKPDWNALDVMCYNVPAREVGGDLYAYHDFDTEQADTTSKGMFALAVGDVSGKGMPAALLMAITMGLFRSVVVQNHRPCEVLALLDIAMAEYTRATHHNCALVYADIRLAQPTDDVQERQQQDTSWKTIPSLPTRIVRVANAGCIPPIIKYPTGYIEWFEVGGLPLGIGLGAETGYEEQTLTLTKGDMIIFTSDGVVEAKNTYGEMFGFERLEEAIKSGPHTSAAGMMTHLWLMIDTFVGKTEPHDDLTIVVVQV